MGDGDGPTRKMNSSEATAFNDLQRTLKSAIPQVPANYSATYGGFDSREIFQGITPEQMNRMAFTAKYTLNPGVRESGQQTALMDMTKGSPDQQAKRAALAAKAEELKQARKHTRDRAEKERIRAELKKINEEENALTGEIAANASANWQGNMQQVDRALPAKELSVKVLVNQNVHVQDVARPYQASGTSFAFDQSEKCQDSGNYCITLLLGNFTREKKISGTTQYTLRNVNLGVPTKPRGMAVIVTGPKEKAESVRNFLKQIDVGKLQALLPK